MSKIRSKGTRIENAVFSELRKNKIYFQKHYNKAPGKPDIALPRKKKAVFIDGDFWHGYKFGSLKKRLPSRYWIPKIEQNISRDKKNRKLLRINGWFVLRVWEHEIVNDFYKTVEKITKFLSS